MQIRTAKLGKLAAYRLPVTKPWRKDASVSHLERLAGLFNQGNSTNHANERRKRQNKPFQSENKAQRIESEIMKENSKSKKENIEALLFDYAEGNLSEQERQKVERLIESNPEYAALLQAYDKNERVECPCDMLFEDKEALFGSICKERKPAVFLTRRKQSWIYSVAAVLLLLIVSVVAINYIVSPNDSATQLSENKHSAIDKNKTPFQENKTAIQSDKTAFCSAETAFCSEQVQEPVSQEENKPEESTDTALQMQEQTETQEPP